MVPTDFEDPAGRALDLALELAAKLDAKVTLLHVCPVPASAYGEALFWPTEEIERAARAKLHAVAEHAKSKHARVETVIDDGDPKEEILTIAQSGNVDLIVMGTHGRKGFAHAVMGSVAERIVRTSPIPVLTVSDKPMPERALQRAEP